MARFLKDPLTHFVLLGAAIFAFFAFLDEESGVDERQIVIPEAEIDGLWGAMSMIYGRAPTQEEIEQLIEPRIREEVLYREALALELDPVLETPLHRRVEGQLPDEAVRTGPGDRDVGKQLATHHGEALPELVLAERAGRDPASLRSASLRHPGRHPNKSNTLRQSVG